MSVPSRAVLAARSICSPCSTTRISSLRHSRLHINSPITKFTAARVLQRRLQSGYADAYGAGATSPPPQRSLPVRIVRTSFKTIIFGTLSFVLGAYIGIVSLRSSDSPQLSLLWSKTKPVSDSESLTLYTPPPGELADIDTHITQHPLAQHLRSQSNFTESRPHVKLPESLRASNLTAGTLAGEGKIAVPPLMFTERDGRSMVAIFFLGANLCGHPGIIHGGLLATLLDEGLARCCFPALPNQVGVTANLKVDYRKPVKAEKYYVLRARTERVEGRKAWVTGWIEELEETEDVEKVQGAPVGDVAVDDGEKTGPTKLVEAEALFIEPRQAKAMKAIYGPITEA